MLSGGLLRLVYTEALSKILTGKLSGTVIQTLFKQFEMFTETVIISLTDLLLRDTLKKNNAGHIPKKSIPANAAQIWMQASI